MRKVVAYTVTFFVLAIMLPPVIGFFDMLSWFYTGHTLSTIEWGEARVCIALVMFTCGSFFILSHTL